MTPSVPKELSFLAAMLHGRRSGLAENERLDKLCAIRSVHELTSVLYPGEIISSVVALQRRMVLGLLDELDWLADGTAEDRRALIPWQRVRFQVENLKVIARGRATGTTLEALEPHLVPLPRNLTFNASKLLAAKSNEAFLTQIPNPILCKRLHDLGETGGTFLLEAALDHAYLTELAFRAQGIVGEDREAILAAIRQEIDLFHLMLAVRGKLGYRLKPEILSKLHVRGGMNREHFTALLTAPDLVAITKLALGRVIDTQPKTPDPTQLEVLAWNRLQRLANKAFRYGHMSMGAVVGYTILRRVELANLITLSEGIRTGIAPATLRAQLIPQKTKEAVHV